MGFQEYSPGCEKGGPHSGKKIMMICLNPECENRRLCCLACIDELHRKHELISLNKFDQMMGVLVRRGEDEKRFEVLGLLEDFERQLLKELNGVLATFTRGIEANKDRLRGVVQFARESINLKLTREDLEQVHKQLDNPTVCKYLELIQQAEGEALRDADSAAKTFKTAQTMFDKTIGDVENLQTKAQEDINGAVAKLKKLLGSEGRAKLTLFSKVNKAASLEVSADQKKVMRTEGAGSYPIALIEQPLTEYNNQFTVKITEQPGNKGCWLGVCVKDIVENTNFGSCYGIGKGTWAIDQVGANHSSAYSWSHHDTAFNSQPKGFQFQTGDTVTVRVNFEKSTVVFEKGNEAYEMPVQLKLGDIFGFVGCTYQGDTWLLP